MTNQWRRQRKADEVPTPVAVAVSDFCRRARAPASAAEVRDALAFLSVDEDFRATELAGGEPSAQPLGPYAVVDVLRGASPSLAAERHKVGYYELARALGDAREGPPLSSAPAPAPASTPPPEPRLQAPTPPPQGPARRRGAGATTVEERIAPRRRERGERRELPAPRGRFAQLPSAKRPVEELSEPSARPMLEALLEQHRHRVALLRALGQQYQSRGRPPSEAEVLEVLSRHGLRAGLEARERELVLGSYAEQRGSTGRVAWALGVSPAELGRLAQALELKDAVEEIKERFRREALAPRSIAARLDLLGRQRYLAELGIKRRYLDLATSELRALLREELPGTSSLEALAEASARRHGTTAAVLLRAMDLLGLSPELEKQLSGATAPSSLS